MDIKPYQKKYDYSYTLGVFPTIELLCSVPEAAVQVVFSSNYQRSPDSPDIQEVCGRHRIPCIQNDRLIAKLSAKENCYVLGVFRKYELPVRQDKSHIVLCRPGNSGNLGTILRTALGYNYRDVVIIEPAVDLFDPKTIRSSMGAIFKLRFSFFSSLEEYIQQFDHHIFSFRLNARDRVENVGGLQQSPRHALLFGNESSGLEAHESIYGTGVVIPHSPLIDSLNLPVAVSIALYEFTRGGNYEAD